MLTTGAIVFMNKDNKNGQNPSLATRVWRSIFQRSLIPGSDDERKWVAANTVVLHIKPASVPAKALNHKAWEVSCR